jgi:hypothetical protein
MEANVRLLGEKHPDTLAAMGDLALTYQSKGQWDDAPKLKERVIEARVRLLGEEHPDTLAAMGNLASTYWSKGRLDDAQKLETKIRLYGEQNLDTVEDEPSGST